MELKQCSVCLQQKNITEFNKCNTKKDGLQHWCRHCQHEYSKIWYKKHRERHLFKMNKYHNEHQEERTTRMRQWYKKNPGYAKKWGKENSKSHKESMAKVKAKRKRNLGWVRLYPNPFDECEEVEDHHVDNKHVVSLPKDLHRLYNGKDPEAHRINLNYIVDQLYKEIA